MFRKLMTGIVFMLALCLPWSIAAQQSGGGGSDGVKNTCEVSGGTFTGSESGNWACCWDDWGCYGCVDGNCKIKCHNQRCRKANGQSARTPGSGNQQVDGLAPSGKKPPVAPTPKVKTDKLSNKAKTEEKQED